jgi:uncharacterized protein YkwD
MRYRAALLAWSLLLASCSSSPTAPTESGPPTDSGPPPDDTNVNQVLCVSDANRYRAMVSAPPVSRSTVIEAYALTAAQSDHASGQPHGYSIAHATGTWGENELVRQSLSIWGGSVRATIQNANAAFWGEGPAGGHYQNLVNPRYTQVGCAWMVSGTAITLVQHFRE